MPDAQPPNEQQIRLIVREETHDLEQRIGDRTIEAMHDIETNLMKAFHSYARGQAARMQSLEVTEGATQARMAALEERVLALETKRP